MEGNRDEAIRCIEIALESVSSGKNYEKAEKFLRKANSLYPTQRAKDLLNHVCSLSGKRTSPMSDENGIRKRKVNFEQTKDTKRNMNSNDHVDYNQDQVEIVKKIKKCKDYYEVLGITKEATDSEIRKSYKKLALQLHPDKNRAPGAAEAFKEIGNAVAVLTDIRKRKEYDLFKTQHNYSTSHYHSHNTDHNSHEYAYARNFESDISADELFNMFFGGFPQQRMNGQRFAGQHRRETNQPSLAFGLILVLIMISMLSSFFTSDPLYSLAQTSKYNIQRRTIHLSIPYYVKENFAEDYQGSLSRLENSVEDDYIATMKQNCYRERSYRDAMIARARSFGSRSQVTQAQGLKVPSCENLVKIGLTRFAPY